ncbi:hypothetical protein OG2516_01179 [Oceanicola granulosus HTCC2516]|uniref:RDD domain-containing protein n=1 Tax=Oceanicola granulosus (strain ATCC BAA-861 / DSM 15982 / KCTC 12143 / HTCC2516) TaxID=314256 RepID=Q2CJ04_OCEGH|nr:RDD family protein [Oceanicola granulosus]EAR52796.1 hypothetical protein OG2516_01179 [Oceanicola granulosus HTCC2516]
MHAASRPDRFAATRLPDPDLRPDFYRHIPTRRLVAWLIDVTLIAIGAAILVPFTLFTGLFFFPLMMLAVGFLYRWSSLATASATPGMMVAGIELREHDGERLSNGTAFLHTLGYQVSVAVMLAQVASIGLMLTTRRHQGLSDHVLGTAAIRRPR